MKLLILGDSFAADWTVKYKTHGSGWPNLLANTHDVINLAQAGTGEYKIFCQLESIQDIKQFDCVIISHTSPYRLNTRKHPVHCNDKLHNSADLMLNDIEYHSRRLKYFFNKSLRTACNFFRYHYSTEYQETVYKLLRQEINKKIGTVPCIVVSNTIANNEFFTEDNIVDFCELQKQCPGLLNHLSQVGNEIAYQEISKKLGELNL